MMDPGAQFSLFAGWRHPAMGVAGMGMDLTQAAYRYNQNMMEYYTCKTSKSLSVLITFSPSSLIVVITIKVSTEMFHSFSLRPRRS